MPKNEIITSKQNQYAVLASRLADRKHRDREELFVLDGVKLYAEARLCGLEIPVTLVNATKADAVVSRLDALGVDNARALVDSAIWTSDAVFSKISQEKSPEGIISVARYIDKLHKIVTIDKRSTFLIGKEELASEGESVIMLESVRDPGNLGTIIRSAYALGIDRLVLSLDCADIYNPRTVRAAMGALFRMRIDRTQNLDLLINAYRESGRRVLGSALDRSAQTVAEAQLCRSDIVVIGNEGHGISPEVRSACDGCVYIPMQESAESLNAAMAATIFAWEIGGKKDS